MSYRNLSATPMQDEQYSYRRIGDILLDMERLAENDLPNVLCHHKKSGLRFGESALALSLISMSDLQQALAEQFRYSYLQPGQAEYSDGLLTAYHPFSRCAEVFRTVRTQLQQLWFSKERKAVLAASINEDEGSSLFTANLAASFSQLGNRTLLIDANLRQPGQDRIFNLKSRIGLTDVLAGRVSSEEALTHLMHLPHLSILPAGTMAPNPQELLGQPAFEELNSAMARKYDVILIDAPALAPTADTFAIAPKIGGLVLVCRKDQVRLKDLCSMRDRLAATETTIVGSVFIDNVY